MDVHHFPLKKTPRKKLRKKLKSYEVMTFITGDFHDLAGLEAEEAHVWCTGVRGYPVLGGPKNGPPQFAPLPRFWLNQSDLNGKMFEQTRKCQKKKTCLKQNFPTRHESWLLTMFR